MSFFQTSPSKMLIALTSVLAIAGQVSAAPAPEQLSHDDVILLDGSGNAHIMKAAEFDAIQARDMGRDFGMTPSMASGLVTRGCPESNEVQVLSNTTFLAPDIAISPVISGENLTTASVSVTSGYSVANSLSVGSTANVDLMKDLLSVSLSLTYTETWTTTDSQTLSFNVPTNMFGVIVSQPYVREVKGNVLSGCTDSPKVEAFTSTTYSNQDYKGMSWVRGVMRLCTSETYPIPYCIGKGSHT